MGKNPRIGDPIDRLLQERQQFATWLARLDATADAAPESVRGKIRADYQARLDSVIEQLRSHTTGLVEQLDRHKHTRSELLTRETQAREIMSEAEIRHAVGEYTDSKWEQIRGEAQKNLVAIREELTGLGEEIAELENVQKLISGPAIPEPVAPPPPAPEPEKPAPAPVMETPAPAAASEIKPEPAYAAPEPPKATPSDPSHSGPRPAAVRPVKPKEPAPAPGRTLWFPSVKEEEVNAGVDELAFLKSVSEDEKTGPSARRASGGLPRPPEPAPMAPQSSAPLNTTAGPERPSSSTGVRTLKCGECGTMNRPTEWYCERCGAELADL